MNTEKKSWTAPKLEELSVEKTLTGSQIFDQEATRNGNDVFVGGPQS
jgi:hypothetical protein